MRCGARCFIVEMEIEGQVKIKSVNARTPAGVRKTIRSAYGKEVHIKSVKEK